MLEAVGAAIADVSALVGLGVEGAGTGTPHGVTDEKAEAIGVVLGDLFCGELEDCVYEFRLVLWGAALPPSLPLTSEGARRMDGRQCAESVLPPGLARVAGLRTNARRNECLLDFTLNQNPQHALNPTAVVLRATPATVGEATHCQSRLF